MAVLGPYTSLRIRRGVGLETETKKSFLSWKGKAAGSYGRAYSGAPGSSGAPLPQLLDSRPEEKVSRAW